jgi:hypothetical protein
MWAALAGVWAAVFGFLPVAAMAQEVNLSGMQLWNVGYWQTVSVGDFMGPNYEIRKLAPIALSGCRNGYFSGSVVVTCSTSPINGLKAVVSDLVSTNGTKIPAQAVWLRYPELVQADNSWCPVYRFDRFMDTLPDEIAMVDQRPVGNWKPKNIGPVAMQPIWVTVKVPADTAPGEYEGTLTITSDLNAVPVVPVKITVAEWALPDPKNFRVTIFGQQSPESLARYYDVPRWSDKHFELIGKSLSLMSEINSRQAILDVCIDFYGLGGVPETMIKWVKQPDGTYKHDFTVLDKYMDTVKKSIGKPTLLRVNCWKEWNLKGSGCATTNASWSGACQVSSLDPATGQVGLLDVPPPDSPAFVAFWRPVFDELRKRIEARGWWDVTALGHTSYCWAPHPVLVDAYHQLWPDGKYSYTAHNGTLGGHFRGTEKGVSMPCFHTDVIWGLGRLQPRGGQALLRPRPGYHCFTFRNWWPWWDLVAQRRVPEEEILRGHDGVSDFGADFFPVPDERGRRYFLGCGAGTGGPHESTLALLSPGPEAPTTNVRFEAIREGVQICEAMLFIEKGIAAGQLSTNLSARANAVLDERGKRLQDSYVLADKSGRMSYDPAIHIADAGQREAELFAVAADVAKTVK